MAGVCEWNKNFDNMNSSRRQAGGHLVAEPDKFNTDICWMCSREKPTLHSLWKSEYTA